MLHLLPRFAGASGLRRRGLAPVAARSLATGIDVLFGSQTGTAEWLARDLVREGLGEHGLPIRLVDMSQHDGKFDPDRVAVMIVSCYGEGEPTDNAKPLFHHLESGANFKDVPFAVFGLGSSRSYPQRYQAVGKRLDAMLESLGGQRLVPRAEGDDSGDLDDDFDHWKNQLMPILQRETSDFLKTRVQEPAKLMDTVAEPYRRPDTKTGYVTESRQLVSLPTPTTSTRHIEYKVDLDYEPGDHLAVFPKNSAANVARFTQRFGLSDKDLARVLDGVDGVPPGVSLNDALYQIFDLSALPRRSSLKRLAELAEDDVEAEKLMKLAADNSLLAKWHLGSSAVSELFLSIPREKYGSVLQTLPLMAPRFYSISSSPLVQKGRVSITIGATTALDGVWKGVATAYKDSLFPGDTTRLSVRQSSFRLPEDPTTPILMFAAGTGIAPFIGFLEHLEITGHKAPVHLFFGFFHENNDFLYKDRLFDWLAKGTLSGLHPAASHDQDERIFVQDVLTKQGDLAWKLIDQGANLYVCGNSATVGKGVDKALAEVIHTHSDLTPNDAGLLLQNMVDELRYQRDVF